MAEALIPFGDLNSGFTRICSEYREAQQKALDQLQELLATHRKYPDGATVFVSVGRFKDVPGLTILSARFDPYQDHKYLLAEGEKEKWRDAFELATEARDKILREQANGLPPDTLTAQQSLRIVALEMQLHDAVGRAIMDVMKLSAIRTILANLAPMVDEGERTMKFGYSEIADYSIKNLPIVLSGLREIQKIGGGEGE